MKSDFSIASSFHWHACFAFRSHIWALLRWNWVIDASRLEFMHCSLISKRLEYFDFFYKHLYQSDHINQQAGRLRVNCLTIFLEFLISTLRSNLSRDITRVMVIFLLVFIHIMQVFNPTKTWVWYIKTLQQNLVINIVCNRQYSSIYIDQNQKCLVCTKSGIH